MKYAKQKSSWKQKVAEILDGIVWLFLIAIFLFALSFLIYFLLRAAGMVY